MKEVNNTMEDRFDIKSGLLDREGGFLVDVGEDYEATDFDTELIKAFIRKEIHLAEESLVMRVREEIDKIPTRCIECDKVGINPFGECQCSYGGEKRYMKKSDILSLSLLTPKPKGDK